MMLQRAGMSHVLTLEPGEDSVPLEALILIRRDGGRGC